MANDHVTRGCTEDILQSLRRRLQDCESQHHAQDYTYVSSGCVAFDQLLPQSKGFRTGQLVEWLSADHGSGAAMWGLRVAINALQQPSLESPNHRGRSIAVIDRERTFYPPTAAAMGLDLQRLLVIQPRNQADAIWALDQTLRCPSIAAVWADIPRLTAKDARRLQLAAEEGDSLGLLLRPLAARGQPSWADVQIHIEPLSSSLFCLSNSQQNKHARQPHDSFTKHFTRRRWRIRLLRCRGTRPGNSLIMEIDHATGTLQSLSPSPVLDTASAVIDESPADLPTHSHNHGDRPGNPPCDPSCASPCDPPCERQSHETHSLHLAAQLARPATGRRSARA